MYNAIPRRIPRQLTLGEEYWITYYNKPPRLCRLIQPTEKGYNFLDLHTSKCILKKHLYPSKLETHVKTKRTWFWVNEYLIPVIAK